MYIKEGGKLITILAKLFGKKYTIEDIDGTLIYYSWLDKYYISHYEEVDEHEDIS